MVKLLFIISALLTAAYTAPTEPTSRVRNDERFSQIIFLIFFHLQVGKVQSTSVKKDGNLHVKKAVLGLGDNNDNYHNDQGLHVGIKRQDYEDQGILRLDVGSNDHHHYKRQELEKVTRSDDGLGVSLNFLTGRDNEKRILDAEKHNERFVARGADGDGLIRIDTKRGLHNDHINLLEAEKRD